jgi:glycosyltransferase involved in cell wall biosynthesis
VKSNPTLTIIVPTLNEVDNVVLLTKRINGSMARASIDYTILFIDDHSTDGTYEKIMSIAKTYPVRVLLKKGTPGKAQSIIEGMEQSSSTFICMIDGDLQYPPESIAPMVRMLERHQADIVLTRRIERKTSIIRKIMSSVFHFVFVKLLFGIAYDTQSGLKVFRRSVLKNIQLNPSQWSFDLEFIVENLQQSAKILTKDIIFSDRHSGEAKIKIIESSIEIAKASLGLRMRVSRKNIKQAYQKNTMFNAQILKRIS